ncbi:MAG: hypothetical protein J5887_01000 [Erysipelotrichaceae bacterium]|nr:hypothetical protein [Erysipelotrichaceae bacterium]
MDMKKAGLKMSVLMGAAMSTVLSLVGMLSSGKFTLKGYLLNVLISFFISFLLGLIVPIRKLSDRLTGRLNLPPGSVKARLAEALVSDAVYTPLMTTVMVYLAYRQAVAHGARISFLPMWLPSMGISLLVAFVLAYALSPLMMKIAFRGMRGSQGKGAADETSDN